MYRSEWSLNLKPFNLKTSFMNIIKTLGKLFLLLIVLALGIMVYADVADYDFDRKKAAKYVTENAAPRSRTCCAWYVMRALQEGGCPAYILPAYAYEWLLPRMDWEEVKREGYVPKEGDIIVFPAIGKHIWGHIQMWNGHQWVSDFRQKNKIPAKAYAKTNWKIYRCMK